MAASPAILSPVPFWFLRHGETDWNAQNLSQGSVDIPLNAAGLAQAHSAAALLQNRGIRTIVASPLGRAHVTAEIAAAALGLPFSTEETLREVAFGVMEGQPMLADWFTQWVAGEYTPDGAESFPDLTHRSIGAINLCTVHPAAVLVVAHGALFRGIRAAMGLEPNFRTPNAVPILCTPPAPGGTVWTLNPVA